MTIGQSIGVLSHAFKITNDNEETVQLSIKIDFSTASDDDIKSWITSNRVIAGQRPWRSLSKSELIGLNEKLFVAQNIGRKVKSRAEQVQSMVNAGFPNKLAKYAVDHPEEFQEVMNKVEVPKDVPEDDSVFKDS